MTAALYIYASGMQPFTSIGGFPLKPVFIECVAEVRDSPNFFKISRIEMENYPIIIRMGMY
jgi:hypothetical protein